jgi:hypothetical protein
VNCNIIRGNICTKEVEWGGSSGSHTPTAVDMGDIATLFGINGLTQNRLVGVYIYNTLLTPASNLITGCFGNHLYVASTQNCNRTSPIQATIAYVKET